MNDPVTITLSKAGGEGSRGGHVVGHDRQGEPIYASKKAGVAPVKPVSDEESHSVIRDYKNFGYMNINEAARHHDNRPKAKEYQFSNTAKDVRNSHRSVDVLSHAIANHKLEKDTTLYRGMAVPKGAKVGDILTTHGFTSATTGKQVANRFAAKARERAAGKDATHDSAVATIHAKAGTPALDFSKHAHAFRGEADKEKEHLFDHRVRFRVVEDHGTGRGGHRHLTLEPIHPEDHQGAAGGVAKAQGAKPLGAAYSHARKVSDTVGGQRAAANRYLKKKGHKAMSKAGPAPTFGAYQAMLANAAMRDKVQDDRYVWSQYQRLFDLNHRNMEAQRQDALLRQMGRKR